MNEKEIRTISPAIVRKSPPRPVDFFTALRAAKDGDKITKLEWGDQGIFGHLDSEVLKLRKRDGKDHNWIISSGDMAGQDWVII